MRMPSFSHNQQSSSSSSSQPPRPKRNAARSWFTLFVGIGLLLDRGSSFTPTPNRRSRSHSHTTTTRTLLYAASDHPTALLSSDDYWSMDALVSALPPFATSGSSSSSSITSAAAAAMTELLLLAPTTTTTERGGGVVTTTTTQTQVLTDVSHISLDLAAYLGQPGALALRLAAVVGRLCTMAADYLPDQTMLPEEMVFQAFMLTLAVTSLARSAKVPYMAALARPTLRDGKTFRALFAPAGVSWRQYKALTVSVLEWVHVTEGDTLELAGTDTDGSSSSMYWLYDGRVQVERGGGTMTIVERERKSRANGGEALIGESQLLDHIVLQQKQQPGRKRHRSTTEAGAKSTTQDDSATLRVVSAHATVLRVNVPGLKQLMANDQDLEAAMRSLLFQSMEAKLRQSHGTTTTAPPTAVPIETAAAAVQPI